MLWFQVPSIGENPLHQCSQIKKPFQLLYVVLYVDEIKFNNLTQHFGQLPAPNADKVSSTEPVNIKSHDIEQVFSHKIGNNYLWNNSAVTKRFAQFYLHLQSPYRHCRLQNKLNANCLVVDSPRWQTIYIEVLCFALNIVTYLIKVLLMVANPFYMRHDDAITWVSFPPLLGLCEGIVLSKSLQNGNSMAIC